MGKCWSCSNAKTSFFPNRGVCGCCQHTLPLLHCQSREEADTAFKQPFHTTVCEAFRVGFHTPQDNWEQDLLSYWKPQWSYQWPVPKWPLFWDPLTKLMTVSPFWALGDKVTQQFMASFGKHGEGFIWWMWLLIVWEEISFISTFQNRRESQLLQKEKLWLRKPSPSSLFAQSPQMLVNYADV